MESIMIDKADGHGSDDSSSDVSPTSDTTILALLGKKQVLKRRFNFWTLFGFVMCDLVTWESMLLTFSQGLSNGGPAGLVYGFLISWFSTLSIYAVISELASLAPISSGQFHWVYILAPPKYKKISSYIVGWLTSLAWVSIMATATLFAGIVIQGILILQYPNYSFETWHGTLFTWAVILLCVLLNVVVPDFLPKFQLLFTIIHVGSFIAIVATLLTTADIGSASSVFLTAFNGGGWPTQGLSFCVGFIGNVVIFAGADAPVHLSEEVSNAAVNVPWALCLGLFINGLLGFGMIVTVLFCLGDLESVLNSKTGFPFIQIFYNSVNNVGGAVAMTSLVLILTWAGAANITTAASRMAWSFARDKGVPLNKYLSKVEYRTRVPIIAVSCVGVLSALLALIYIGSFTAFNNLVSLATTGFYGSYFLPCAFLLYHRLKGHMKPRGTLPPAALANIDNTTHITDEDEASKETNARDGQNNILQTSQENLFWGPWYIPGLLGTINNAYACVYMIFVLFWSMWPPVTPVNASTMNYAVVVTSGVMILSVLWYYVRGRKDYEGPLIDEGVASIIKNAGSTSVV